MKSVTSLVLGSLAVLALAAPAAAGGFSAGINLHWDDCAAGGAATNKDDACDSNAGAPHKLVLSVEPSGQLTQMNGAQGIVDIQLDAATLPDFWQLGTGGCRNGRLAADAGIGSATAPFSCLEPWSQIGNQVGAANFGLPDGHGPNWGRITWIIAVPGEFTLDGADGEQYILALNLLKGNTTSCAGCATPACLVANEMRLTRPAQAPGGDVFIYTPATNYAVTWQGGGTPECPGTTPTQNTTWGQVKHLYR